MDGEEVGKDEGELALTRWMMWIGRSCRMKSLVSRIIGTQDVDMGLSEKGMGVWQAIRTAGRLPAVDAFKTNGDGRNSWESPKPPRNPAFDASFTLTTHLFPATYLKTTGLTRLPKLPAAGETKEERRRVLGLQVLDWSNDTAVTDGY